MSFEMWLFTIKKLAQSYDMAKAIYDQMSAEQQEELKRDYEEYIEKEWK